MENIFNNIINKLISNPDDLVGTFYIEKGKNFFNRDITNYSPYFLLNNSKLTCILEGVCDGNIINTKRVYKNKLRIRYEFNTSFDTFELETIKIPILEIISSYEPYTNLQILKEYQSPMNMCLFKTDNILDPNNTIYISSDEYTNNLLISIFINEIYTKLPPNSGMKGTLKLIDTTIYNKSKSNKGEKVERVGLNLYQRTSNLDEFMSDIKNFYFLENRDVSDFSKQIYRKKIFTESFIIDIFTQLLVNLQFLQKNYQFTHGNLFVDNICISKEPIKIEYSTIRHTSELTFRIRNFSYSSMNLKRYPGENPNLIRLFNSDDYAKGYFMIFPFKPIIDKSLDEPYYLIEDFINLQTLAKIRHLGIPYYSSFDTISIIVSLLLVPEIYYGVMTNPILKNVIWDSLWHPKDQSMIFTKITNKMSEGINSYEVVLDILRGTWIKCKLTDELVLSLSREYLHK